MILLFCTTCPRKTPDAVCAYCRQSWRVRIRRLLFGW